MAIEADNETNQRDKVKRDLGRIFMQGLGDLHNKGIKALRQYNAIYTAGGYTAGSPFISGEHLADHSLLNENFTLHIISGISFSASPDSSSYTSDLPLV